MERWTRFVLRLRWPILLGWIVVILVGGYSSTKLNALLSNTFTVPGTDSERARSILERHYGDRSDGVFTVVYTVPSSSEPALRARLQAATDEGARRIPTAHARLLIAAGRHVLYGDIVTTLSIAKAKSYTGALYRTLPQGGGITSYVTGQASIQHDLDPIFSKDLRKGESIALPIALFVLLAVFGLSLAVTIPFIFAAATIMGTLGIVYLIAHELTMATYVTNLVQLIGLGIAIDYSLLVVYRFREQLRKPGNTEEAIVQTMATAGRAVVFSGATVAIGLALLVFMPVPFMRSMGVGGFLIPVVSLAAALTLQPVLLSFYGRKGTAWIPLLPARLQSASGEGRAFWHWLATAIMKRPLAFLAAGGGLLAAIALPVFALQLTPGSASGIPRYPQSVRGFQVLKRAVGPGVLSPSQIVVDSGRAGGARDPRLQQSLSRLAAAIAADPETAKVRAAPRAPFLDPSGRYEQIIVAGHHEYGSEQAQRFVERLRHDLIPAARFPAAAHVLAGGGPAQGVDFLHQAYRYFPWLVLAVLVLTYLLLLRAFRSLLLPLKAVLLNLLSVAASYGMLVIMFKWGLGSQALGLYRFGQVEGWIPIFLFAMLFGLSMDYEVFMVTRMREEWDDRHDNRHAVAHGLERTGRIVTAAAVIMVAAFSGFVAGRIVGLQEFGLGLAVAIFVDATVVRALLVPSLMALFGRYNWWLPRRIARVVWVEPSPLGRAPAPALRATAR